MVSAELALAIPGLTLVVLALAWVLGAGMTQAVLHEAARAGARAAARGESSSQVRAIVDDVVPGAGVVAVRSGRTVRVTVSLRRQAPLPVLRSLDRTIVATATGWLEVP